MPVIWIEDISFKYDNYKFIKKKNCQKLKRKSTSL